MSKLLTFSLIIVFFIGLIPNINAWEDCPFGFEDEPYPGSCGRYEDTNNDGICDLSQSEPIDQQSNDSSESEIITQKKETGKQKENKNLTAMIISFFLITIFIIFTKILKLKKILKNSKEKIIWNVLLLIFFLPSALTGIILVIMPSFPFLRDISLNFIELHSYTSFVFMWISGYHVLWHTRYYLKNIKSLVK